MVAGQSAYLVGCYTEAASDALCTVVFDRLPGNELFAHITPTPVESLEKQPLVNLSFLTHSPCKRFVYAVGELEPGLVHSFAIIVVGGKSRKEPQVQCTLRELSRQSSGGDHPCDLTATTNAVYVANYSASKRLGSVAVLRVDGEGILSAPVQVIELVGSGPNDNRQDHSHAHSVTVSPCGQFLLVCDLGSDAIWVFTIATDSGELTMCSKWAATPGDGPRHLKWHPTLNGVVYVLHELSCVLSVLSFDAATGELKEVQRESVLLNNLDGGSPMHDSVTIAAELQVNASGSVVYCSVRGNDTITRLVLDPDSGRIQAYDYALLASGHCPRHFVLEADYLIVAHQNSSSIAAFRDVRPRGSASKLSSPNPFEKVVMPLPASALQPVCLLRII